MDIIDKIELLRKEKSWTKYRLAREIGISSSAVYNWYNKNYIPSCETLCSISLVFDIPLSFFYTNKKTEIFSYTDIKLLEIFHSIPKNKRYKVLEFFKKLEIE